MVSTGQYDIETAEVVSLPFGTRARKLAHRFGALPVPATTAAVDVLTWLNTLLAPVPGFGRSLLAGFHDDMAGDPVNFERWTRRLRRLERARGYSDKLAEEQANLYIERVRSKARRAIIELACILTLHVCSDKVPVPPVDIPTDCTALACEQRLAQLRVSVRQAVEPVSNLADGDQGTDAKIPRVVVHPDLLNLVTELELKGDERSVVEAVATRGKVRLVEINPKYESNGKPTDAWKGAKRRLNDKKLGIRRWEILAVEGIAEARRMTHAA